MVSMRVVPEVVPVDVYGYDACSESDGGEEGPVMAESELYEDSLRQTVWLEE